MANFINSLYSSPYTAAGSALSDGWGGVWDWLSGKTANELNYQTQSALMTKQMQLQDYYNVKNWKTSQTEGPSLYRQGLEDAGFNPILAVSGSSAVPTGSISPVSGSVSAGGAARAGSISDIMSMFSWVTGAAKVLQEISNLQTQAANTRADTHLKAAQTGLAFAETDRARAGATQSRETADTSKYPGWIGNTYKSLRSMVSDVLGHDVNDDRVNVDAAVKSLVNTIKSKTDDVSSSNSASSARSKPLRATSARARHESPSIVTPQYKPHKRRHN